MKKERQDFLGSLNDMLRFWDISCCAFSLHCEQKNFLTIKNGLTILRQIAPVGNFESRAYIRDDY